MTKRTYGLHAKHILAVYDRAEPLTRQAGRDWYHHATDALAALVGRVPTTGTADRDAGVLAALSPRMPWDRNVSLAAVAILTGRATGALSANTAKANAILAGAEPLGVLKGRKVQSFYQCLIDPWHPVEVCIDRHAVNIAAGRVLGEARGQAILDRVGGYDRAQVVYREAAFVARILPMQMQAITWLQWRMER